MGNDMRKEKETKTKAPKIVIVRWHDAGSGYDEDDAASHYRNSIGYQTKRTRAGIWLSMEDDGFSHVHFIPRGMVLSVTPIPIPEL